MADDTETFSGTCYCGAVTVTVQGPPAASGYCHCESCRTFHGAPFMAWSAWPDAAVTRDGDVTVTRECADTNRVSCARCGGKVMGLKPGLGMSVVFPTLVVKSGAPFRPLFHQFYAERVMDMADGLPKFADVPEDFGGSGKTIPEPAATGWSA